MTALRDPRQSSAEAARELEAAARVAEENIRRADERGAVDPAEGFAPTLGVGLVSCGGCGRIIALDALAKHRAGNCARARRLAGLERIAGALGAAPPPGPAIVEDDAPSPKKKAKVTAKKRTKKGVAETRGVAGFRAGGLAAQIAPDLPPHLVGADADATGGATTGATTVAKTTTKTTVGTVAVADGTGAAPKRRRTSGAGSNRGKKAAAAAAADGGHLAGGTHAPYAGAHLRYAPPGYVSGVPGAPPGYVSAAGAGRAGHGGYSAAASARPSQQQRRARDAALAPADAVVPLASPADPRKVRALRQRALYAMMFHESRDALVANVTPHVVAADAYLAGAKETVAPWPKRKQLSS